MKVKAEACWHGGDKFSWRLTLPDGRRTGMPLVRHGWDRKQASEALDLLELEFGVSRQSVRFQVR